MKIDQIIQWMTENKDFLSITEVLAPLWDGGPPHINIRIESPTWRKVKARACVEPALGFVKEDEAQRVPAILSSKSMIRRLNVQKRNNDAESVSLQKKTRKTKGHPSTKGSSVS